MKLCSQSDCQRESHARGMCTRHYNNWLRKTSVATAKYGMRDEFLAALPATRPELVERLDCNRATINRWIAKLRDNLYICDWRRPETRGPFVAVYALGQKADVPCSLQRLPDQVTREKYRTTHADQIKLREKARWARKKATRSQATWASALGVQA